MKSIVGVHDNNDLLVQMFEQSVANANAEQDESDDLIEMLREKRIEDLKIQTELLNKLAAMKSLLQFTIEHLDAAIAEDDTSEVAHGINCLELAVSHLDGYIPQFLNGEKINKLHINEMSTPAFNAKFKQDKMALKMPQKFGENITDYLKRILENT